MTRLKAAPLAIASLAICLAFVPNVIAEDAPPPAEKKAAECETKCATECETKCATECETKCATECDANNEEKCVTTCETTCETPCAAPPAEPEKDEMTLMREEQQRLSTEYALLQQRQKNELLKLELEKQAIQTQAGLEAARRSVELANLREQIEKLQVEAQFKKMQLDRELGEMKTEMARRQTRQQFKDSELAEEMAHFKREATRLQNQNNLISAQIKESQLHVNFVRQQHQASLVELEALMSVRQLKDNAKNAVLDDIKYLHEPFDGHTLHITDRRITLNGAIMSGTADYVCDRIHFFNNQCEDLPIFIVIDYSPGGSVMEGYRIVKAIEASRAPVHVVVKSFAASMAAAITTLADHSYAFPNAIILHHQMSSGMSGNLTQQAEKLENAKEWSRRLSDPIAEKMGVSPERFVELMYENNSTGDWEEFADRAVELHWVNNVVQEIREIGVRERPTGKPFSGFFFFEKELECVDAAGETYIKLPRLRPFDHYFIHNPDGYYRTK